MDDTGALKKLDPVEAQKAREEKRVRGALGGKYRRWRGLYDRELSKPAPVRLVRV